MASHTEMLKLPSRFQETSQFSAKGLDILQSEVKNLIDRIDIFDKSVFAQPCEWEITSDLTPVRVRLPKGPLIAPRNRTKLKVLAGPLKRMVRDSSVLSDRPANEAQAGASLEAVASKLSISRLRMGYVRSLKGVLRLRLYAYWLLLICRS